MDKCEILGHTFFRYQFDLLGLCVNLHMYINGSMECYTPIEPFVTYKYLIFRRYMWIKTRYMFDDYVYLVLNETIREYEERPGHKPTEKDALKYLEAYPDYRIEPLCVNTVLRK